MVCNTAIFYDIENLLGLFSSKATTVLRLDEIHRRILQTEGVHGVSIQRAYADWSLQINRNLQSSVLQVGVEPIHIFNTNKYDKVKNAADVSLIIDAVELLSKRPEIDTYVIASGDGIFAFLAKKLHEHGKRVIGCSFDHITNILFRNACDHFISLDKADNSLTSGTTARAKAAETRKSNTDPKPVAKKTEEPAKKIPSKFPKNKYSEALVSSNIEVWQDPDDAAGSLLVIRKLIETMYNSNTTIDEPDLEISLFNTYVNHYIPGFKVSNYKFTRLGNFMRFVLTGSPYCLYAVENNVYKMAKRGTVSNKGNVLPDMTTLQFILPDGKRYTSLFDVPEGTQFIYSYTPEKIKPRPEPTKQPAKRGRKPAAAKIEASLSPAATNEVVGQSLLDVLPAAADGEGVRKWIKGVFTQLTKMDALSSSEARRITTDEYSQKVFGVKTPVFKEIESRSNLDAQRTAPDGKIRYWKESFKYNDKTYLVYKDWIATLHRDRFITWLKSIPAPQ